MTSAAPAPSFTRALLDYVIRRGDWVPHLELVNRARDKDVAIDTLNDLVRLGLLEINRRAGYRLPGGPLVRAAARELLANKSLRRSVKAKQTGRQIDIGVAERRPDLQSPANPAGLVTYQMYLPEAPDDKAALQQAQRLAIFMAGNA